MADPTHLPAAIATALTAFVDAHPRLLALTGAGVSTASGIPAYRDASGQWQRRPPMTHQQFTGDATLRQRYWARSFAGWPRVTAAQPNAAHRALVALERAGTVQCLVTQNVDGLHQRAGSTCVIDLHGNLARVTCLACGAPLARTRMQALLAAANPGVHAGTDAATAPDGDADVDAATSAFVVPACPACHGVLMPDVVFHGANVPRPRVAAALAALDAADALLVAGSSLAVYSGYRFCVHAHGTGKPIVVINQGSTRADALATLRVDAECGGALQALATHAGTPATATASAIVDS